MLQATVVSTNIDKVGFQDNQLFIRFRSGITYQYDNVCDSVYFALTRAESAGQFFHRFVNKKYTFKKLDQEVLN